MVAPCHAARHVQVDELVPPGVTRQQVADQPRPAGVVERVVDPDLGEAALETREVLAPAERDALVGGRDFIDAVAENEAAVQDRNPGLGQRHELAVEIDDLLLRRLPGTLRSITSRS